jgi:hypothetical protein
MRLAAAASIALAFSAPATATSVYRCVGANGEVAFVSTPCHEGAERVKIRGEPATTATDTPKDPASQPQRPSGQVSELEMAERGNIRLREQRCMANASDAAWRSTNAAISRHQASIAAAERNLARARNNLAGATWDAGLRSQIASDTSAIAQLEMSAAERESTMQQQCRDQAQREIDDLERLRDN